MDITKHPVILSVFSKLDRFLEEHVGHWPTEAEVRGHQAFRWDGGSRSMVAVKRPVKLDPASLLGIDDSKAAVMDNTRRFIAGSRANNVLLWGERGTGKSSLLRSLLHAFAGTDLRMIEVYKHDILTVRALYDFLAAHPSFRFIILIDDMSFEEGQSDYKEMKTIMDGGLEQLPDNLLFYATSNRKHLVVTRFSDDLSDEVRPSDTVEEKVSLADRFGIRLGFYHISQETYLEIVDHYAKQSGVSRTADIHRKAIQWELQAGARNGRTAEQFVRSLKS
ncbi:MAG: ATP-binding protein [Nitrospirota bacterium]